MSLPLRLELAHKLIVSGGQRSTCRSLGARQNGGLRRVDETVSPTRVRRKVSIANIRARASCWVSKSGTAKSPDALRCRQPLRNGGSALIRFERGRR